MPAKRITRASPKRRVLSMSLSSLNVLKHERYHAPLHFPHVFTITLELCFQHRFFAETARADRDDQDQSEQQPVDRTEQQWCSNEKQHGARVHRMPHDRIQTS